jgi:hypothetical protein
MERHERFYVYSGGTIIVGEGDEARPWEVTYLTDDPESPYYPAIRVNSSDGQVPSGPAFEDVAIWAIDHDRTGFATDQVPVVRVLRNEVPDLLPGVEELRRSALSQHVCLSWEREPDDSYSWAMTSLEGVPLQSGVADSWDDARLAMIENLYPQSGER